MVRSDASVRGGARGGRGGGVSVGFEGRDGQRHTQRHTETDRDTHRQIETGINRQRRTKRQRQIVTDRDGQIPSGRRVGFDAERAVALLCGGASAGLSFGVIKLVSVRRRPFPRRMMPASIQIPTKPVVSVCL